MKRYLILTSGEYSDYTVDFLELPENCPLSDNEVLTCLNVDSWYRWEIAGEINGELKGWEPMILKTKAESEINGIFCCYDNRPHKTVLDKKYTKEECLKIATDNDSSGEDYWKNQLNEKYRVYEEAYDLYHKLV